MRHSQVNYVKNLRFACTLPRKIIIGTHHKTGTAWLRSVFKTICDCHSLVFFAGSQENLRDGFDVFFQPHSIFQFDAFKVPFFGLHMIRDPRDVIISGCFYHQRSDEKWLHKSMKQFQGLSYQEKINSYSNIDDQILFEMENGGKYTIDRMLEWNYNMPDFFEVKYEDLIEDHDLALFHRIFTFLGFPGEAIPTLLGIAYSASLFSGQPRPSIHVRSGKTGQWENYFKSFHKKRFLQLFGDALIRLGYEENDNWARDSQRVKGSSWSLVIGH